MDKYLKGRLDRIKKAESGLVYASDCIATYLNEKHGRFCEQGEVIANWFLEDKRANLQWVIESMDAYRSRKHPYPIASHSGSYSRFEVHRKGHYTETNQKEKNIAKALFCLSQINRDIPLVCQHGALASIGKIRDYEVPIFYPGKRNIDLVATRGKKELIILELKKNCSSETLLRCILEAFTYSRLVNRETIAQNFGVINSGRFMVICPLIFQDSQAYRDLIDLPNRPCLRSLIKAIEEVDVSVKIRFAVLDQTRMSDLPDMGRVAFKQEWLQ